MSGFKLSFTRRFSMGHRLISCHNDKCATPHGHNVLVEVALTSKSPSRLDGAGNMVCPFARAKGRWHHFVDHALDHAFQISQDDPLLAWFCAQEPERKPYLLVTPGDPTTELLAALLLSKINAFLRDDDGHLTCNRLTLHETPTNAVTLSGAAEDVLPMRVQGIEKAWWTRADQSISSLWEPLPR